MWIFNLPYKRSFKSQRRFRRNQRENYNWVTRLDLPVLWRESFKRLTESEVFPEHPLTERVSPAARITAPILHIFLIIILLSDCSWVDFLFQYKYTLIQIKSQLSKRPKLKHEICATLVYTYKKKETVDYLLSLRAFSRSISHFMLNDFSNCSI